jgi:dTMP kinase
MSKKPVIVFEGIEGSGKTLHIDFVSKYLRKKKINHVKIREPGGNKNSEKIRNLVLSNKSNFNKDTDLLLYLASRSENMEKLNKFYKKKVILLDRFIDSTIAYQHYGLGVDLNIIRSLNHYLLKKFRIDFTFLNIVSKKNMKKRLKQRTKLNRYDKFKENFYNKVQNGFLKISRSKPKHYKVIDSNLSIIDNKKIILNKIEKLLR